MEKDEWFVKVFRRTEKRGWEIYRYSTESERTGTYSEITAAPRKGCVEIKKLRIRINLFHHSGGKIGNGTTTSAKGGQDFNSEKSLQNQKNVNSATTSNGAKSEKNNGSNGAVVVRRMDTILVSTRRGGAVVLKFQNEAECLSFSDKLMELNKDYLPYSIVPDPPRMPTLNDAALTYYQENSSVNGGAMAQQSNKRKRRTEGAYNISTVTRPNDKNDSNVQVIDSSDTKESGSVFNTDLRRQEIMAYIVRLLHDDSFIGFVNDIEKSLASAPDCEGIFAALGNPSRRKELLSICDGSAHS